MVFIIKPTTTSVNTLTFKSDCKRIKLYKVYWLNNVPQSTLLEWRLVFWIAVVVLVVTNIVYLFLGSGEAQPWNDPLTMESKRPSIVTSQTDSLQRKSTLEKTAKSEEAKTSGLLDGTRTCDRRWRLNIFWDGIHSGRYLGE